MSFLNPLILSALALVSVPLLIHLIRRRKLDTVRWAAMEFLLASQRRRRRRLRIEELLLLLLRMLIVAVCVFAFARPVMRVLGVPLLAANTRVHAVIVLDDSLSMAYRYGGKSSFERAQAAADSILSTTLQPGDAVSLVLASDAAQTVIGAPSYDRDGVRRRIRAARVLDRGTDYLAAAQAVNAILKQSRTPVKEIYWLTDDQASAWATSRREGAQAVWEALGRAATLTWVSVGPPAADRANLSVGAPTLSRETVTPHLPERIESQITNYGDTRRDSLIVNLKIDGRVAGSTRLSIPAGGSQPARFVALLTQPGTHTGVVEIEDPLHADALDRDNSAAFVVRVRDRIRVLVVDPRPEADPAKSQSFYLMTAMAPAGASGDIAPHLHLGGGLASVDLQGYDAVVLAGMAGISSADRAALAQYVRGGGGLLLFPGPQTDSRLIDAELGGAGILPAELGGRRSATEDERVTINPATIANGALGLFRDTASLNLGTAAISTYCRLTPVASADESSAVTVMARLSTGEPAFVERKVGLGSVVLAATSASIGWSQLPLKPSFVPLVYQLVTHLGEGASAHRNLAAGEPLRISLPIADSGREVRITAPDGSVSVQRSALEASGVTLQFTPPALAGLHRVEVEGSKTRDAFAVALPDGESDLTAAPPQPAVEQAGLPKGHIVVAENPSALQESVARARYGAEIWRPLVWLLIGLLLVETHLAQRFGRR
jgi:hypothetical protein